MECQKKNISDVNEVKHCALDSGIRINHYYKLQFQKECFRNVAPQTSY